MKENSFVGGSRRAAAAAAKPAGGVVGAAERVASGVVVGGVAARGGPKLPPRPGFPPRRPPERLNHPSTFSLKKSVRMIRFDVMPPCECPTSQNALMFF